MRLASSLVALLLAAVVPGCASLGDLDLGRVLGASNTPTADLVGVSLSDLTADGLALTADVRIDNPLAAALPLVNLDYALTSGGRSFVDGAAALDGSVPAGGSRVVSLPIGVRFSDLLGVLSGVSPGSVVPYEADLVMNVDAPVLGPLSLPLSTTGELPVPTVPKVSVASVDWSESSFSKLAGTLKLAVENTNDFPIDIENLSYGIALGGVDVAQGALSSAPSLEKGAAQTIDIPLSVSLADVGAAALGMLGGSETQFATSGSLDLSTPFGPISLPFAEIGKTLMK